MKDYFSLRRGALALALVSLSGSALAAVCPSANPQAKANKLYLLFPGAPLSYPSFGFSQASATTPAAAFSAADLPGFAGTTAALRAAIKQSVELDYCEFNVQVLDTSSLPPATHARRNIVAVTTASDVSEGLFGFAQNLDDGDRVAVDYSYVWAKTFQDWAGGAGGALGGANSTLQRWARAIGDTAAHEAGHNYGLFHGIADGAQHLMAAGSGVDAQTRAGSERYFGDKEFSILAANVGLSMQTMWNWELVNPNAAPAHSVEIRFLHPSAKAPPLEGAYRGCDSPWIAPSVSGPVGPARSFQSGTYYPYVVKWSTPNPEWGKGRCAGATGSPGQAAGGARFYVGAAFMAAQFDVTAPEPVVLQDIILRDAAGQAMSLNPRAHGFDAGSFDEAGNFNLTMLNPGRTPLILRDLRKRELPRVLAQEQMTASGKMQDFLSRDILVWPGTDRSLGGPWTPEPAEAWSAPAAKVDQDRNSYQVIDADDCKGDSFLSIPDTLKCGPGAAVGLFPSTTIYFTAESVDPDATYWDAARNAYVQGPLSTRTYYQVSGRRLDLDHNGIDDYLDAHPLK